ncbi:FecCD family ABC transporter permease [Streptomyces tagetis]|uniref:Iron ABC transporter permease n=1 Tax=Streptomyces tagetis TaxID=2820809 RepID=A0A940XNB9_9ACTN|nr:iron ABC transporter permease [Streptomyces sp. RG38]MBQ0826853.1 iron ABC transporter permease [Streptomyces sp. RG38]
MTGGDGAAPVAGEDAPVAPRRPGGAVAVLTVTAVLCASILLAVSIGQMSIPFPEVIAVLGRKLLGTDVPAGAGGARFENVVWEIRLPRVLLSVLVGAGLAMCGVVMQASLRNPLADPYLLGVSAGGSLGATVAILSGFGAGGLLAGAALPVWAFLGSLAATAVVLLVGALGPRTSAVKLVLAGAAVNALCSAITSSFVYFAASAEGIRSVTFWMLGSLASATWADIPLTAGAVLTAAVVMGTQIRSLDVMLTGDESSLTLGVDSASRRRLYLLVCALVTGILVARTGVIGFVGLLVPHVVRGIVGSSHRRLLPVAVVGGGLFLLWADVIARVAVSHSELPIGIVTAVLGAPVFLHMLTRKEYRFG